jgi:hypothetical protein
MIIYFITKLKIFSCVSYDSIKYPTCQGILWNYLTIFDFNISKFLFTNYNFIQQKSR